MSNRVVFEFCGEDVNVSYEEACELRRKIDAGIRSMMFACATCSKRIVPMHTCSRCRAHPKVEADNVEPAAREVGAFVVDPSGKRRNGGIVCDMLVGPCACGAWHKEGDA